MLGVLPLIQNRNFFQDSLQEVVSNLNLILSKINSTKVVRVNHPSDGNCEGIHWLPSMAGQFSLPRPSGRSYTWRSQGLVALC